ncbi:hypothetical protein B0I72DRAFT_88994 [Yarrowia lipolytica]|jgi:membrane associated rhomboid family serine protease|uniref:YALI0D00847p n=3 Tax=Yarrowia lipolytica TaxID=4952 RepID=Q6CAQ3_YARLI|nr:YALI0D00847p [Yarrowia lipolytica CLIB122]KAB8282571.1 hypothetical protein BKA91DRAFT_146741 [Yarrowia lipolytica]KAE8173221.1 hypothetical protein BKA90DRAFT_81666 [Yarrowia lipolytica]KAJ8054943.1 hypothetical protein LXG23DRAFT_37034 [Yarrowia lipolytica]QNP97573.1 DSC E3 ubiquitin ligase complex subunit 2 [Yarrowia lipolytica]RDW22957.1 hypothetical protein B0I71DRAFT_89453 [Yarrowia lipolytica]|eukprot:XP_502259.1 YALI0D00847p [Yarrowia lipolytica CLIB122]
MFVATNPGFVGAPVTRALVTIVVCLPVFVSLLELQPYFGLQMVPFITAYHQWWRLLTWQEVYVNQSEIIFASLALYNLRIVERLLGSRQFLSYVLVVLMYTSIFVPLISAFIGILPFVSIPYIPSGPTALIFSLLVQYRELVPVAYKFKFLLSSTSDSVTEVTLTDKIFLSLCVLQLTWTKYWGSIIIAFTGWTVGVLLDLEILPGKGWRVPLFFRFDSRREAERIEAVSEEEETDTAFQRPLTRQIIDTFR